MYSHVNLKNGQKAPLIAGDVFEIVMQVSQITHSLNWGKCLSA